MKKIIFMIVGVLFILLAKPALAVQFKNGNDLVFDKTTKIDETIFVSGNSITFDSPLNGDLLCAGRDITITGNIKGDVLCVGQNIKVSGIVDGDVRVAGQFITVDGSVSRNLYVVGQDLTLSSKSNIKGDVLFGVQKIDMSGIAGRDLAGAGEKISVSGSLIRNAVVTASSLNISDTAKLGGDLDYFVEQNNATSQMMISTKSVKGEIRRHDIVTPEKPKIDVEKKIKTVQPGLKVLQTIFGVISFTLVSFVLLYFASMKTGRVISLISTKPVISGLVGLATFVVAPIALLIICSTVVGIPVAFVVLMIYTVSLFLASLYSSIWLGKIIMAKIQPKTSSIYLAAFVGCLAVGLVSMIPVLGWLIMISLFLMGLGATFLSYLPEK